MPESTATPSRSSSARAALWAVLALAIGLAAFAGARSLLKGSGSKGGTGGASAAAGASAGAASGVAGHGGSGSAAPADAAGGTGSAAAGRAIPVGDPLPEFSLTDRSGRVVSTADLHGKVWIANFIFTRCATVCPTLTREMAVVRTRLAERGAKEDVLSVSFTIDPLYDTPEVLKPYAQGFHADPSTWFFLTGDAATVVRVVRGGFKLMMSDPGDGPPMHSNRFVLVDAEGRTRSSHLATDEGAVDSIVADALALRDEARSRKTADAAPDRGPDSATSSGDRQKTSARRQSLGAAASSS